ncbi:50S ribosomal protein L29 [Membranicola marinus]|uniref:Large ribosomal subunit protein uL29 n=1 Tax=Membranihabitans marinus TaxID=1227546 RepID=A0A953LB24_9BACT|nr:50S ribosomal protein L29 [Membranihabitans marinus]MBY5959308.1 50S ribosomal protein L29 [Membranihabitans marinus]
MAALDPKDYKDLGLEDLSGELEGTEARLSQLQFDHATRGIDNPLQIRSLRRNIARLKTELRARELKSSDETVLNRRSKIRARRAKNS